MDMATCMYCTSTRARKGFSREHVIPKAFCSGYGGVLTLAPAERPAVCIDCNAHFGRVLDLALGRDSYEAMLRLQYGLKASTEAREIGQDRLEFTLPTAGKLGPLRVEFVPSSAGNLPGLVPIPQARFPRRDGGYVSITEEELVTADPTHDPDIDTDNVLVVWSGIDPEAGERVRTKLAQYGIEPKLWEEADDLPTAGSAEIDIEVRGVVDGIIARALAKIAFNYLVWCSFDSDPGFPLRHDFDAVREFIVDGGDHWRDYVRFPAPAILATDSEHRRSTRGHLITLEWERFGGITCHIALFNDLTYRVDLTKRMDGIWRDIGSGHHYNPDTSRVEPLGRTSLSLPTGIIIP